MLFTSTLPNFDFLLVNLALAALRPRARRIGRSLVTERAPDGTVPSGATDASGIVPGGRQVPWSRWPRTAWKWLALASRLGGRGGRKSSGSLAGKPNASAQAGRVEPKPDLSLHVSRELAAALPLASLALRSTIISAKFLEICSVWPRFACDTPVIFSGLMLAALRHFLQIFSFFYQLISTQISLPHRRLA